MGKGVLSIVAIVSAVVLFVALNVVSQATVRGVRIDLTENRLYTLSEGTRSIVRNLSEPVRLTLYYSASAANEAPAFRAYAQRVTELLREIASASRGKVVLRVVDPAPFSEEQDEADQAGLQAQMTPSGRRLYFGLVGASATDERQVIPLFDPRNEELLEYDITRMVYLLSNPAKATIGLMAGLPVEGMDANPMMRGRPVPPWQVVAQLRELFNVKSVPMDSASIPEDVRVLVVIHPKNISDRALYAIDQFVLRGGRLMAFVDPWCEADVPPGVDPMQAMSIPKASHLNRLFEAWGVEMLPAVVAGDRSAALPVSMGTPQRPERVSYVAWMGLRGEAFNRSDPVAGVLQLVNMATAGILRKRPEAAITFDPLIQTSDQSMQIPVSEVQFMPDPRRMLASFVPSGERLTLAARVSGRVRTAFPQGNPERPAAAEGDPSHLAESKEPLQAIIVADVDMLTDRFWVQEQRLGNVLLGVVKGADNGDLVVQGVDNLAGSSDLINIRARGRFARPFEKVREIQSQAEQQWQAKQQELQERLRETEAKIAELQRQRPDAGGAALMLTPEQQAEIRRFGQTAIETRRELRNVQFQLNKDVEALESRLKLLNIGAMPLLVGVFALGLGAFRASRRRGVRRAQGDRT